MCNTWQTTSDKQELTPQEYAKLPPLKMVNITGGEPFLRNDLAEIVDILKPKTGRIIISTNGFMTDRIVALTEKYPNIGIRVSLEGFSATNDELRGIKHGFDKGLKTIVELKHRGMKDIGFGITVSDKNVRDMMDLYKLACAMGLEFSTAIVHNTYYFHKDNNVITSKKEIVDELEKLKTEFFRTNRPKNWLRAYFIDGMITYFINDAPRPLPCLAGTETFYLDPFGDLYPCNAMNSIMGNIREQSFDEIWQSKRAQSVRKCVHNCKEKCWMICTVAPSIKKEITVPVKWVAKNILKYKFGGRKTSDIS
jgi:MoaA/NifB/PqqE/SkfB family radical SAM enzyme